MQFCIEKRMITPGFLGLVLAVLPPVLIACQGSVDPPDPAGGGQEYRLSYLLFETTVAPVLSRQGCDAGGGCHGGGIRGTLELSPLGNKDLQFDFEQVVLQVNGYDPEASPLLAKPLARSAGGTAHSFEPFASPQDPDYQTILTWIEDGSFVQ